MTINPTTSRPTLQQVALAALEIAEANPEFIYLPPTGTNGNCVHTFEGKGHCLIGQAMEALGHLVPEGDLGNVGGVDYLCSKHRYPGGVDASGASESLLSVVRKAQGKQDTGTPWGDVAKQLRERLVALGVIE